MMDTLFHCLGWHCLHCNWNFDHAAQTGWLVAGCMLVRAQRVWPLPPPTWLTDMPLSKQLRPRSARSPRRRCSSGASSSHGRSPTTPTASSPNMKSSTTKEWVCTPFEMFSPPSLTSLSLLRHLHLVFCLHAAVSGIHKILQVASLSHNCNNEWDAPKILIRH